MRKVDQNVEVGVRLSNTELTGMLMTILILCHLAGCHRSEAVPPMPPAVQSPVALESTAAPFHLSREDLAVQTELANGGNRAAAMRVADHYAFGEADIELALPWLRIASKQGDVGAMRSLAVYLGERGGPQNCGEAMKWLERAGRVGSHEDLERYDIEGVHASLKGRLNGCVGR